MQTRPTLNYGQNHIQMTLNCINNIILQISCQ